MVASACAISLRYNCDKRKQLNIRGIALNCAGLRGIINIKNFKCYTYKLVAADTRMELNISVDF